MGQARCELPKGVGKVKAVFLEQADLVVIRKFLQAKFGDEYSDEWDDDTCICELTNWLYYNTNEG